MMSIIFNPFIVTVVTIGVLSFLTPLLVTYTVLAVISDKFQIPAVLIISVISFILIAFYSTIASLISIKRKCDKYRFKTSIWQGLKTALISTLGYLIVYIFPVVKLPFIEIAGDTQIVNAIADGFIVGLNAIGMSIITFFDGQKDGCKLTPEELKAYLKNVDKHLDTPVVAEPVKTATIAQ